MTSKRSIASANETGFLDQVVKPVLFARLDFSSGVQRLHTEIGDRTITHPVHGSETYTGIGDFGGVSSQVIESISGAPASLSISLTGVKSAFITDALTDDYFRRDADVLIGLDDVSGTLLADPEYLFSGYMDKVDIVLSEGLAQMTLVCESRGTNLLSAPDNRFTDEDKQAEVSGDLSGEYIYRMEDLNLSWGKFGVTLTGNPADNSGRNPGGRGRK